MKTKKYAAIDIGSNAVRLLISNIVEERDKPTRFKKSSLVRVPVRLGADVFIKEQISEYNVNRMLDTIHAFKNRRLYSIDEIQLVFKTVHPIRSKLSNTSMSIR